MTDERKGRRALLALLAGAAGIGFAPILVRLAKLEGMGPTAVAFYRLLFALPVLGFAAARERAPVGRREAAALLIAGLFFALDLALWHASIVATSVANATVFANFAPAFVTLGAWLFFRERFRGLFLAGLALAIAGAALLMAQSVSIDRRHVAGDALGLAAAVFYAGYLLLVGRLRARHGTATIMAWSGAGSAIGLAAATVVAGESFRIPGARAWAFVVALALVSQLGGQTFIAYALAHLPVAFSAVSLLLQPIIAAALAWALFAESLGPWQIAGGVVILGGIVLARLGSAGEKVPAPAGPIR